MNTEHNFDVDIVLPTTKQKVIINKDFVQVNEKKIYCDEIEAIKYGVSLIGKGKKNQKKLYNIDIKSKDKTATINFKSEKVAEMLEEDHTYFYILSGLWQYVKKGLIDKLIHKINNQENFKVGEIAVSNQGFHVPYKNWFFGKEKIGLMKWENCKYYLDKGILHIKSINDSRMMAKLSIHNDWNAVVLNTIMHYLWQDNRREKLALGQTI